MLPDEDYFVNWVITLVYEQVLLETAATVLLYLIGAVPLLTAPFQPNATYRLGENIDHVSRIIF